MAHEILIPRLGWSMDEGTFIQWLIRPGSPVAVGQALFELEGEKALQEIESVDEGILYLSPDAPSPGSVLSVGAVIGYLLAPGEPPPRAVSSKPPETAGMASAGQSEVSVDPRGLTLGITEVVTQDVLTTPRARRVARELGVDWTKLRGSGRDGRVRETDVLAAYRKESSTNDGALATARRRAIARRLRISRDRTIPVTLTSMADATQLVGLREQIQARGETIVPTYADIVACLAARVLLEHPRLAARWSDDQSSLIAVGPDSLNIGIAVDVEQGLVVPIIRDVARKTLRSVAEQTRKLVDLARGGRLPSKDMSDGVLTITNLGGFGIDTFTPVINYPEIAILGMGAIRRELVVAPDDRVVARDRISLSLTFDHAAIDGAPAAAFLRDIASAIETRAAELS